MCQAGPAPEITTNGGSSENHCSNRAARMDRDLRYRSLSQHPYGDTTTVTRLMSDDKIAEPPLYLHPHHHHHDRIQNEKPQQMRRHLLLRSGSDDTMKPVGASALALRKADRYHAGSALTAHSARNSRRTTARCQRSSCWRGNSFRAGPPPGARSPGAPPRETLPV